MIIAIIFAVGAGLIGVGAGVLRMVLA